LFDDTMRGSDVTNHKGRQVELNSTTTVTSEVRELAIGRKPLFTTKRLRGTLVSRSPQGSGEPSIAPARDTTIQGVSIGGFGLSVNVNCGFFQKYDTRSKVLAVADDPKSMAAYKNHFVAGATVEGHQPGRAGIMQRDGVIYTTIVKEIRWEGKPYPGAKIDGHTVMVPDFGTAFFGELLIGSSERRLTMLRFELGSPDGGWVDAGDSSSNGSFFP
jgi:hypothetical protein